MYLRRTGIFLIFLTTAALIAGTISCAPALTPAQYNLTISSTERGQVTSPGEGIFTYDAGEVVDLVAEAEEGYSFVNWTGNIGTIANVNAASSTITMNGTYSITANFKGYDLTISSTTEGWLLCGNVTTPGEGTFTYSSGTVVNLVAQTEEGCQFVGWTGDVGTIADVNAATTTITMNGDYSIRANFRPYASPMIAAGGDHTVGLRADGTVLAVGWNYYGQCNVGGWTNIVQVATGADHTVGLKSDGTVVAMGYNLYGECNVGGWANITQVAAGTWYTVGLKSDGTVVAVGWNYYGQCNVGSRSWTGVIQVAAGADHTVGLRADGTVVATGRNLYGRCNVGGWTNILQVAAGYFYTVGLKADGTLVAVGDNPQGQCNVGGWTNIVRVAAGVRHTMGLKSDGTVVAVGDNIYGQCNVGGWHLF
jgi:uncharacterized repeat protein (TIGR02543 family)